jgi:hypothetical protein
LIIRQDIQSGLASRLNSLQGVELPSDCIYRFSRIYLSQVGTENSLIRFLNAFEWVIGQVRK